MEVSNSSANSFELPAALDEGTLHETFDDLTSLARRTQFIDLAEHYSGAIV